MILAGDIGGTNTRLALYERAAGTPRRVRLHSYLSREHGDLGELLNDFCVGAGTVSAACFGIAGPVRGGRCQATNLPWVIDAAVLGRSLGTERVALLNDLEAHAWALDGLAPAEVRVLAPGAPDPEGNAALIAAGTGLGQAGLAWDGRHRRPFATEGGHSTFAPRDTLERKLSAFLERRFEHVSWERVLSGPGLVAIHEFLSELRSEPAPSWLAEEMRSGDPAAAIAHAGLGGRSEVASDALDLFVTLYGAEAGNLALKTMATAGVWVGGGIAPKILPRLEEPRFLAAFSAKGRMRPLLEAMPVAVILSDDTALDGAARYAGAELLEP